MKKVVTILFVFLIIFGTVFVYASSTQTNNTLTSETTTTTNLVELKDKALKSLEDYQIAYGDNTYGLAAYILNIIRIYSY